MANDAATYQAQAGNLFSQVLTNGAPVFSIDKTSGPSWISVGGGNTGGSGPNSITGMPPLSAGGTTVVCTGNIYYQEYPNEIPPSAKTLFGTYTATIEVAPEPALWTGNAAYTANATAGAAFGWSDANGIVAEYNFAAVVVLSGPAWLNLSSQGYLTGTPPVASAGTTVVVTLQATVDESPETFYQQNATLTITIAPVQYDLWTGDPFNALAIQGQPFSWTSVGKVVAGSVVTGSNIPAWATLTNGVLSGTPVAGTGGTVVVVGLSAAKAGVVAPTTLTITIQAALPPNDLWIGDPFAANAQATIPFAFPTFGRIAVGATPSLGSSAPSWLSLAAGIFNGTPPAGTANTVVEVPLTATSGSTIDTTILSITVSPPPPPSMFQNPPYTLSVSEGQQFNFQIVLTDTDAAVTCKNLPPWLTYTDEDRTFTGLAPLGTGGSVVIVALTAVDGANSEDTTFTLTINALASLALNLDVRTGEITFLGGPLVVKHGDTVIWNVDIIPADQVSGVTGMQIRIKEADDFPEYGCMLYQSVSARFGANGFQFAAMVFTSARLDHVMALLDPVAVQPQVPFLIELQYALNGAKKTSQLAPFNLVRDFALDTSAGGAGAADSESDAGGGTSTGTAVGTGPVFTFGMSLGGGVTNGQVFGYFVLPTAALITGISATIQAPDALAGVTVSLVDNTGTPFGSAYGVTVPQATGANFADLSTNALVLVAGSIVQAKVTGYVPSADPSAPAQNLAIQVICRQ